MGDFGIEHAPSKSEESEHDDVTVTSRATRSGVRARTSSSTTKMARDTVHGKFENRWERAKDQAVTPQDTDPFAAGSSSRKRIEGKGPNDGGYATRLHEASGDAVAQKGRVGTAVPAAPVLGALTRGVGEQRDAAAGFSARATEEVEGQFRSQSADRKRAQYSAAWCEDNTAALTRYEFEQVSACIAYNAWCPLANAADFARHEIIEMAALLGFKLDDDKDAAAFVAAMETALAGASQLVDAKVLQGKGKTSWSERNDDPAAKSSAQPELRGAELGPRLSDVPAAYQKVQDEYSMVYKCLLDDRARALRAKAGASAAEIAKINGVIAFWVSAADTVGSAVTASAGIAGGGVAARIQKKVGHKLDGTESAGKLQDSSEKFYKEGGMKHHYEREQARQQMDAHYNAKKPKAPKVVEEEFDAPAADVAPEAPASLPSLSPSSIVKFGLELLFKADITKLQAEIAKNETQAGGAERASLFVQTQAAAASYKTAADHLKRLITNLDAHGLQDRQQGYVELGTELDRYAVEHAGALRSQGRPDLALAPGKQRHGTTMAVLAKIEQFTALSNLAAESFQYDELLAKANTQMQERGRMKLPPEAAHRSPNQALTSPPPLPAVGADERDVYMHIGGTYLGVIKQDEEWRMRFERVSQNAAGLMKRLTGSKNAKNFVGKKF